MKILILGGDGYLGWPTAMHFSSRGYEVTVVDNYLRRKASEDVGVKFLYDNPNLIETAKIWEKWMFTNSLLAIQTNLISH